MVQKDTIQLLQECNSGIKMGIDAIDELLPQVKSDEMAQLLRKCKVQHNRLEEMTHGLLQEYGEEDKEPGALIKGMSRIKTNAKMALDHRDETIAALLTDGCNQGIKSLSRYLNEYEAAEERAKDIAKKLIEQEEQLEAELRKHL
jgi:hypothetical protein